MELLTHQVAFKPLHLVFIGDIQWAGRDHQSVSLRALKDDIARGLAYERRGEQVLFVGPGDYIDFLSPSNRARLEAANLYDTALDVMDKTAMYLCDELFEAALAPTVGKWAGLVHGHHFRKLADGTTSDQYLCRKLRAPYLGTSAILRFDFQRGHTTPARIAFVLWLHHGVGAGQTGYYPLTRLEKVAAEWEGVDIFAMGHTTKQAIELKNRMWVRWTQEDLSHRTVHLIGTGGYSRAYIEGARRGGHPEGGYVEKKMLAPSVLGSPVVHVIPRRHREGGQDTVSLDVSVET